MNNEKIKYEDLSAKAKEAYNYAKISGRLADYGYFTLKMSNDNHFADFIITNEDGILIPVQQKGRPTVKPEYYGKNMVIMYWRDNAIQYYNHDDIVDDPAFESSKKTESWVKGQYSFPGKPAKWMQKHIKTL